MHAQILKINSVVKDILDSKSNVLWGDGFLDEVCIKVCKVVGNNGIFSVAGHQDDLQFWRVFLKDRKSVV